MTTTSPAWQQAAASILLSYTLRGALLSFLYLVLPATLRADGMSLTFTALSSLVFLPVGLTWLWSTAIDRNPGSGRRRWITGALLVAAAAFGVMAMLDPVADYAAVLTAAMIVAAAAATIATATDAAIIDGVPVVYRGWANALQPTGVALGGLAIAGVGSIYARHGWTVAALSMAAAASVAAVILRTVPQIVARSQSAPAERPAPRFALLRDPSARRALAVVIVSRAGIHLPMGIFAASRSMPDCRWLRWRWLATCSALLPV
jgi:MFS family permease